MRPELDDLRRPPRPRFAMAGLVDGKRVCPMCGEPAGRKRGWWHQTCVVLWRIAAFPGVAIADLIATTGRICWSCRERGPHLFLELEHVRPLWSLTPEERTQLRWWLPFNLQLLCRACHKAKTAAEARERFDLNRARDFAVEAEERGLVELGVVPDRRRVIRRAS